MTKQYLKYLIEGLSYSFEDDGIADEEMFAFSQRKIGDAIDILSNAGPVYDKIVYNIDYGNCYYYGDKKQFKGPMVIVMQKYIHWKFDHRFTLDKIYYVLLGDNREFLEFEIEDSDEEVCSLIYCFAENEWECYRNNFIHSLRECKSIWETIRHIIKMFNNKDVQNIY